MISRRNIRVKVMQTIYSVESHLAESGGEVPAKPVDTVKILQKHFDQTRQLFIYLIHFLTEVARYAETDARNRASKHLPTKEDLNVNIKLAGNELLWKILDHPSYKQAVKEDKPEMLTDADLLKKIYQELVDSEKYQQYIAAQGRDKKEEKEIISYIFDTLLLPNETFTSYIEEYFSNWDDDAEMVVVLMQNFLNKPAAYNFQELLSREKWQFAKNLLQTTLEKKELALQYIKPKLKNWDPDRIASLDMILMRMGVCEFLFFETIPPKVTINEYIDLAKEYSTQQSGQFVNGILDNIHKDLVRDNQMNKVAFSPTPGQPPQSANKPS
ncbi:transcription antitermination factor NusB [Niastella populi]|uniref:Transcription antitermination factor NusB n=1 Tax=Niastella populi TaxID=550983 RepID=A0A1V9FD65_9BACT|nr:transcription antitermination factor NusB [Niastella populi]OQP56318.1 transcription antitermination factor NusB [Niastella populi]